MCTPLVACARVFHLFSESLRRHLIHLNVTFHQPPLVSTHGKKYLVAFPLCVGILQEAMGKREYWRLVDGRGQPPGLMGMWPSRAITFIENHDTGQPAPSYDCTHSHAGRALCSLVSHRVVESVAVYTPLAASSLAAGPVLVCQQCVLPGAPPHTERRPPVKAQAARKRFLPRINL